MNRCCCEQVQPPRHRHPVNSGAVWPGVQLWRGATGRMQSWQCMQRAEGRTTSRGGSPRSPSRQEAAGVRATPPASGGAHPLTAAIMRPPFHPLTTAAPPQRPPGSFRVTTRKSPPERLPLYLLQHRSWLMHGPAAPQPPAPGADDVRSAGAAGAVDAEQRLRRALSLRMRRWALYEFLTPMIDRGYLTDGSMAEQLTTLGLDQVQLLALVADLISIRRKPRLGAIGGASAAGAESLLLPCCRHGNGANYGHRCAVCRRAAAEQWCCVSAPSSASASGAGTPMTASPRSSCTPDGLLKQL